MAIAEFAVNEEDKLGVVPMHFLCPISLEVMQDPVTLCTGISYDRASIDRWLNITGHNTCPVSNQRLVSKDLLPNLVLRSLILQWHRSIHSSFSKICKHPLAHSSSSSPSSARQQSFHSLIQHIQLISSSTHLLEALLSLQDLLSVQQKEGIGNIKEIALTTLTSLLSTRGLAEKAVCEKTLELLEMVLLSYHEDLHTEEGMKGILHANLVPTVVAHTMVGVSTSATMLSLRILCRVCEGEESCCRAAAKSAAPSKVLILLQSAQTSSRTKKNALQLLKLLCGQPSSTFRLSKIGAKPHWVQPFKEAERKFIKGVKIFLHI